MAKQRRRYTSEFKAKVAIEALKSQRTIQELGTQFELHPALPPIIWREMEDK